MALIRRDEKPERVIDEVNRLTPVRRSVRTAGGAGSFDAIRVDGDGNVGIGTDPSTKLHVDGAVRATEFQHLSSVATKVIHGEVDGDEQLDNVRKMPVYHWTSRVSGQAHIGPVSEDVDGSKHIDLIDMNGRLIAAVQALSKRVESLESEDRSSARVLESGDHIGIDDVMRLSVPFAREIGLPDISPEDYRASLMPYIAGTGYTRAMVLYDRQCPIATIGAHLQPIRWRRGSECVVQWVVVDPRWRGRDIGKVLVQEIERWADSRGALYVIMTPMVMSGSSGAAEALGYEPFEVWHRKEL